MSTNVIQQLRTDLTTRFPERKDVIDGAIAAVLASERLKAEEGALDSLRKKLAKLRVRAAVLPRTAGPRRRRAGFARSSPISA
jgi:hypothetical protein